MKRNYPLKGASKKDFLENFENYERMRSTYVYSEARQKFSFKKYRHAFVNNENEQDVIEEIKRVLQDKRPVNAIIWASKAYDEYNGSIYSNTVFYLLFHYICKRPYLSKSLHS